MPEGLQHHVGHHRKYHAEKVEQDTHVARSLTHSFVQPVQLIRVSGRHGGHTRGYSLDLVTPALPSTRTRTRTRTRTPTPTPTLAAKRQPVRLRTERIQNKHRHCHDSAGAEDCADRRPGFPDGRQAFAEAVVEAVTDIWIRRAAVNDWRSSPDNAHQDLHGKTVPRH